MSRTVKQGQETKITSDFRTVFFEKIRSEKKRRAEKRTDPSWTGKEGKSLRKVGGKLREGGEGPSFY